VQGRAARRKGRQPFERGAKTGAAQTQIDQPDCVEHGGIRRRGIQCRLQLGQSCLIAAQCGECQSVKLARLKRVGRLFKELLQHVRRLRHLPGAVMRDAEIELDRRQVWREFERGGVSGNGFFILTQAREHDAEIGLGFNVIGFAFEQRAVFGSGLGELARLLQRDGTLKLRG
jgi:hypothetical protein